MGWLSPDPDCSVTQGSTGQKRDIKNLLPCWENEWIENHSPDLSLEADFSPYKVWEVNQ